MRTILYHVTNLYLCLSAQRSLSVLCQKKFFIVSDFCVFEPFLVNYYCLFEVRLGQEFGLHFFEPRYRLLIEEVMADEPIAHRYGMPIVPLKGRTFPQFIYANHSSLAPGSPACLVQVRQCSIYPDRRADVVLKPIAYVWLERIVVSPNSGNLCEATVTQMGRRASYAIEHSNAPFRGP